jgi:hypothetical protein
MKAWLAFKHTTGIRIQHTRGIRLRNVFDLQLRVVVSISQSTKHRVTLFPLCSVQPYYSAHLNRHHRQRTIDRAKIQKSLHIIHVFTKKISSFADNLRKKELKTIILIGDKVTKEQVPLTRSTFS